MSGNQNGRGEAAKRTRNLRTRERAACGCWMKRKSHLRYDLYLYLIPEDEDLKDMVAFSYANSTQPEMQNKREVLLGMRNTCICLRKKKVLTITCLEVELL